ncbi:unnamed protein product [Arabidopsis halleri]
MAPKSSDGEVNDGSSSDPEVTEPMETCTGVVLSLLGAETDESGESEQTADDESVEDKLDEESDGEENGLDEEGEEEELDEELDEEGDRESYKNKEPEWGYDSFEGREDDSANLREYSDKEFEEQCRHYKRQLIETKGFFETSDKFPPYVYSGVASLGDLDKPAMLGLTIREVCEKLTSLCLQRYNRDEASCSFFLFCTSFLAIQIPSFYRYII